MAGKPRKSVVQNIIRNLLEMEIPEIQTASKELAEWIKQLEQHSFKLQHYATEIENWATEEEEADTVELTDLIKDLEATLSDMRRGSPSTAPAIEAPELVEKRDSGVRLLREYGRTGRVIKPKAPPRAELQTGEPRPVLRLGDLGKKTLPDEPAEAEARPSAPPGEADPGKARARAELPQAPRDVTVRGPGKPQPVTEEIAGGYMTPEGFVIRKLRP